MEKTSHKNRWITERGIAVTEYIVIVGIMTLLVGASVKILGTTLYLKSAARIDVVTGAGGFTDPTCVPSPMAPCP